MIVTSPPDPAVPASQLVSGLGTQVLDVAVGLAPLAVPFVLVLGGISWVLHKFGVAGRIELAQLERQAAQQEAARLARAQRREARKRARMDALHEEALTLNRRHDLRRRFRRSGA